MSLGQNGIKDIKKIKGGGNDTRFWLFIGVLAVFIFLFLIPFVFKTTGISKQIELFYGGANNYMADLYNVCFYSKDRNPYFMTENGFGEKAYFPISYMICFFVGRIILFDGFDGNFASLGQYEILGATLFMMFVSAFVAITVYNAVEGSIAKRIALVVVFLASGPFIYTVERGNLILFCIIGMTVFICTYRSDNRRSREFGYIMLAISAAFKGFPAILGMLLLYRKEWKQALRLALYGIISSFGPFLFMYHGFGAIPKWFSNMKENTMNYEFRPGSVIGYKFFIVNNNDLSRSEMMSQRDLWQTVIIIIAVLGIAGAFFVKKEWIRVSLLTGTILMLPANNAFYVLVYMIPLTVALLRDEDRSILSYVAAVLFAVVLMPYRIPGDNWFFGAQNSVLAVNIVVYVIFVFSAFYSIIYGIKGLKSEISERKQRTAKA